MIRWGVVSTGRIAQQFAADFSFVENGQIVAATSRTVENARAYAHQYGIDTVYATYAEMLADESIDAVYIASPHTLHLEQTLSAIAAGKAVLCEKPITVEPGQCERIIAAAADASVYVMEAMWTWFLPAIQKAKQWVDEGRIGKLVQVRADFGYPILPYAPDKREYDAALGGGAVLDMGIYPVALLWLFLGRQPAGLEVMSRHAPNGVEDDVVAILDYEDCLATIGTSFRCKLNNGAYLVGENGLIVIPDFWRAGACHLYELDELKDSFSDPRRSQGLNFETQAVIDDLLAGRRQSPVVPLAASLEFQRTMEAIRAKFTAK
jgi:predicted dehydrogenase